MNVVLFIPLGVFLSYIFKGLHSFFAVIFAPFMIEIFQLFAALGVFAGTDLITNLLGGVIGLWIYKKLFSKILEQTVDKTVKWLSIVMLPFPHLLLFKPAVFYPFIFKRIKN